MPIPSILRYSEHLEKFRKETVMPSPVLTPQPGYEYRWAREAKNEIPAMKAEGWEEATKVDCNVTYRRGMVLMRKGPAVEDKIPQRVVDEMCRDIRDEPDLSHEPEDVEAILEKIAEPVKQPRRKKKPEIEPKGHKVKHPEKRLTKKAGKK